MELLIGFVQFFVIISLAPFVNAVIHKTKCIVRGQTGPSLLQPYRDLAKLLRKKSVISDKASWISRFAPYIVFSVSMLSACFIPLFSGNTLLHFSSDAIGFVYITAVGTLFLTLYGLDQGSSFGGLGSSRELTISALAEPAMMVVLFTFCIMNRTTNISEIFNGLSQHPFSAFSVPAVFAIIALFMVLIAETGRIPIDNPETHLELTMVHEAMILEASGRDLALFECASWIKLLVLISLISSVIFPISGPIGFVWYISKVLVSAVFIGLFEITNAKARFFRASDFLAVAFTLSVISMVVYYLEV